MHFSTATLTKVVLLVGLPGLVVAEPIPANYARTTVATTSQGVNIPKKTGGLLNLGNILGGVRGGGGGGGLLNLGGLLGGSSTGSGGGTGGNNGGNSGGNDGGLNVGIGNGGLLGGGGILGTGLNLGNGNLNGQNGLLGTGLQGDIGVGVTLGRPAHTDKTTVSVKGKRGEVEGEVLDEVLVRRQSGDAANALKLHNDARKKKNLPALVWDSGLATSAKSWANNLAKLGKLQHASGTGQGENLAYYKSTATITDPMARGTRAWLAEEKNYKGQIIPEGDFASYGHYTQCMWKRTTRVGIATTSDGKGAWYTVARYSPQGNVKGQKPF